MDVLNREFLEAGARQGDQTVDSRTPDAGGQVAGVVSRCGGDCAMCPNRTQFEFSIQPLALRG